MLWGTHKNKVRWIDGKVLLLIANRISCTNYPTEQI